MEFDIVASVSNNAEPLGMNIDITPQMRYAIKIKFEIKSIKQSLRPEAML